MPKFPIDDFVASNEIEFSAIRAQGAGGQNVNKVSSAIHLRFDINASSLSEFQKQQLLKYRDKRINKEGIVIIKAQQYRTQDRNRQDALQRLQELIEKATRVAKTRRVSKPSRSSQKKRLDSKTLRGRVKVLRRSIPSED